MKRKLFSAILFGALLTASTSGLTSCKDYDDDISNLQSQIDKLATADQLSAKVSEMQAAISAAQSAAEAKAAAAQTVADAAKAAAADAAAAASKAQSTADAAAAAAAEVQKAADKAIADLEAKAATKDELKAAADAAAAAVKAIEDAHAADKAEIEAAIETGLDAVKAEIAKTNEELAKLAARLDTVEEKLAALEAGEGQEEALKEIQEEVELIADALEDIIGEYTSMVTEVSLYKSVAKDKNNQFALDFVYVAQEKTTTFPAAEGVADDQIVFSADNKNVTTKDSLTIRVSPTNAILNPANISLLNSQGKDLSAYVEVEKVEPYAELLTKSVEGNGLWNVVFKVKEGVDRAAFAEAVKSGKNSILFAVAVNNTESNDVRRVISSYDVTATPSTYEPARSNFQATNRDDKWFDVTEIHNRYKFVDDKNYYATSKGGVEYTDPAKGEEVKDVAELAWKNEPEVAGGKSAVNAETMDMRYKKDVIEVAVGQDIEISVATLLDANRVPSYTNNESYGNNNVKTSGYLVKGFYVTLDKAFAIESNPSEWNAWKKYSYTNVGINSGDQYAKAAKLFRGNKGTISIDDADALGDVIGFRVYAVNLDGTLVDPDGRAFYVRVGNAKETAPLAVAELEAVLNYVNVNGENIYHFIPGVTNNYYSNPVALSDEVKGVADDVKTLEFEITENPSAYGNNIVKPVYGTDYEITLVDTNWDEKNDAAQVKILNPLMFLDDATYVAAGTLKDAKGMTLADVTVSFKKSMPTTCPALAWNAGWDATKQIINNVNGDYKVTGTNSNVPAPVEFEKSLTNVYYGNNKIAGDAWYELTVKNIKKDQWNTENKDVTNNSGAYKLNGLNEYAVDGASHEITYKYNFGEISLKKDYTAENHYKTDNWKVAGTPTAMTFNSWIDFEQIAWKDGKQPEVYWAVGGTTKSFDFWKTTTTAGTEATNDKEENVDFYVKNPTASSDFTAYADYFDGAASVKLEDVNGDPRSVKGIQVYKQAGTGTTAGWYLVNEVGGTNDYLVYSYDETEDPQKLYKETFREDKADHFYKLPYGTTYCEVTFSSVKYRLVFNYDDEVKPADTEVYAMQNSIDGKKYQVKWNGSAWKFVNREGDILPDQSAANVIQYGKHLSPASVTLVQGQKIIEGSPAGQPGTSTTSLVKAWNTVMSNYAADGKSSVFGSSANPVDFVSGLNGVYYQSLNVTAAPSDPYEVTLDTEGKLTFKQKTGIANPTATEGTLTVSAKDCFGIRTKTWTLKYTIKVN
ncbi:MAG: hypothetical protein ACI37N_07410 [Prevotella sp.]